MAYALAFIFITIGIHLWLLFSFIHFPFDKRMGKGPGHQGDDHYDRNIYGRDPGTRYIDLLPGCNCPQKKIEYNSAALAGYL